MPKKDLGYKRDGCRIYKRDEKGPRHIGPRYIPYAYGPYQRDIRHVRL